MYGWLTTGGLMTSVKNPRGYAFVALRRAYHQASGYNWFATLKGSNLVPPLQEWVRNGLGMYDRMITPDIADDEAELLALMNLIIHHMNASLREDTKGRVAFTTKGKGMHDRMFVTLDETQTSYEGASASVETIAERIPDPTDAYADWDDWDELRYRLSQLWPDLTPVQRRYVTAQVDDPGANSRELGQAVGHSRQMADVTMRRVRAKAAKI
jgi:hypothetical protein